MTAFTNHTWEQTLLQLASPGQGRSAAAALKAAPDPSQLRSAYRYCEQITAAHSKSFFAATCFLPPEKRSAIRALYAFCRISDDIVDRPGGNAQSRLDSWRRWALAQHQTPGNPVLMAWADARQQYRVPVHYVVQLLDGVESDLQRTRYANFGEVAAYSYGVAATVGLMSMHIIGFCSPEAIPYAIKLGVALQVTNILRDVGEDWRAGRVYLPQEELVDFHLHEEDLARGQVDDRWRSFMRFQIARNHQLYDEAWPGIQMLSKDGRCAVAAAGQFYRAILDDIAAHDYDVFNRRAHLSAWDKLRRMPGITRQVS